ncbi:protein kinase [Nocardiopsis sp. FIRDI 009]|uniref:protein kinase domain-containing protein n=1 Tax=Nocardiopsis sp. FIRDI 009 TaxID=714197 RepID=UPI000E25C400|nr:protein kinase [Nocardiopsis sp. FIRDI 009]
MTTPLGSSDPERIGPYTLSARIDGGGQGMVYLGHAPDGTPAAVKVLTPAWGDDTRQRARFAQELAAARRVAPFCTAAVLDADVDGPVPYIASEYVPGPTLRSAVRDGGPREGAALDRLAIATVTALTAVHEAGVVHRDVKPGNVILGPDGPRVIDFGIARLDDATRHTTGVVGTPAYMSPEQVRGQSVGPASDVFSWAAVIAFAATGRHAFPGETTMEVVDRVLREAPDLEGVPDRLRPVLERCLDKDPAARPRAVDVLGTLLGTGPATAPLAPTAVLEQAATLVDEGTAVIRPGGGPTGLLPGTAPAGAAVDEDTEDGSRARGVPRDTLVEGTPADTAGTDGAPPKGPVQKGAPHRDWNGPGAGGRGVRPLPRRPGGRRHGRGAHGGALARAAATVVVVALGVLLLVAYRQGAFPEIVPTGSVPSAPPSEAPATGAPGTTGEEPVEEADRLGGEGAVEPDPVEEGTGAPGEDTGTDCAADPHAPGCPSEEPCVADGCPEGGADTGEPGDGPTDDGADGGTDPGDGPSTDPGDGAGEDPTDGPGGEDPGDDPTDGVEFSPLPFDGPVFEPSWPVPGD